jgi:hypothetical protein
MKQTTLIAIILILIGLFVSGCSTVETPPSPISGTHAISGIQELALNQQDLQQLGLTSDLDEADLQQLGITGNGTNCRTDEAYTNVVDSSPSQYSICVYNIGSLNDTQVIIELTKFTNYEALNGTYQYDSLHLYSVQSLISENDYGDQSRFRLNNENDYGGQYNEPGVYYYHLWICKDLYLIHITSGGRSREADGYVAKIGRQILSKMP